HHYKAVILQASNMLSANPNETNLQARLLSWYLYAGLHAERRLNAPLQARQFYHEGLELGQRIKRVEHEVIIERILELYLQAACNNAVQLSRPDESLKYYQAAIEYGEQLVYQGKTGPALTSLLFAHYSHYFSALRGQGRAIDYYERLPQYSLSLWLNSRSDLPVDIISNLQGYRQDSELSDVQDPEIALYRDFQAWWQTMLSLWQLEHNSHDTLLEKAANIPPYKASNALMKVARLLHQAEQETLQTGLRAVVRACRKLQSSVSAQRVAFLEQEQSELLESMYSLWPQLLRSKSLPAPEALWLPITQLLRHPLQGIRYFRRWQRYHKLERVLRGLSSEHHEWNMQYQLTSNTATEWLYQYLLSRLPHQWFGLQDPASIALAITFIAQRRKHRLSALQVLQVWRRQVTWQRPEELKSLFEGAALSSLFDTNLKNLKLGDWFKDTTLALEINISKRCLQRSQPLLHEWFGALQKGDSTALARALQGAWLRLCEQADILAPTLETLSVEHATAPLLSARNASESSIQRARMILICGATEMHIRIAITDWLQQQETKTDVLSAPHPISADVQRIKNRFDAILSAIGTPRHIQFSDLLYQWVEQVFTESLHQSPNEPHSIWQALEYARTARLGGYLNLPAELVDKLRRQLMTDMQLTANLLEEATEKDRSWPPLQSWLDTADQLPEVPSTELCQTTLGTDKALVQLFFDPAQNRLRALWLDQAGLRLRDFPETCSHQSLWLSNTNTGRGLLEKWQRALDENHFGTNKSQSWMTVMESSTLLETAETLRRWADTSQCSHLYIIFPDCLGQLPWEAVPALESLLVRTVSISHWLGQPKTQLPMHGNWLLSVPQVSRDSRYNDDILHYFEQRWQAQSEQHSNALDALEYLAGARFIYLNTPISPAQKRPRELLLHNDPNKSVGRIPVWACQALRVPAHLVILDTVEHGEHLGEKLSPQGFAAELVAAGAHAVVSMLWPCDRLAVLCFLHYFMQAADETGHKSRPDWHQAAAKARQQLRSMSFTDLEHVARDLGIDEQHPGFREILSYADPAVCPDGLPFSSPVFWASCLVSGRK
ncbi:MAG: CHAT domain-containing protein, partial [Pseudomonadota bacterium]